MFAVAWIYIGKDEVVRAYVYVKDFRYVYIKPCYKGWKMRTYYVGKIEDVLRKAAEGIVMFSHAVIRKLSEIYEAFKLRQVLREQARRQVEEQERKRQIDPEVVRKALEASASTEKFRRTVERAAELVEFLRDVIYALHKLVQRLDSLVTKLLSFASPVARERYMREHARAHQEFISTITEKWELDVQPRQAEDILAEALRDADMVLKLLDKLKPPWVSSQTA